MSTTLATVAATAAAVTALAAAPASAAVTFDAATGIGFVGKGEVQQVFSWNNSALQKNASGVTFSYDALDGYVGVCTSTTGEGIHGEEIHNVDHKKETSVRSRVAFDPRVRNQITGFTLTGFGATTTTTTGSVPVVGEACMGNHGHGGLWSSVELVSSTGGLAVKYGTTSVLLPNTVPAPVLP